MPVDPSSRSLPTNALFLAPLSLLLLCLQSAVAHEPEKPPLSSAYWWTLSEDVSPSDLRTACQDQKEHQRRYLEEVARGNAEELSDDRLSKLSFFIRGESTPELFRASAVLEAFSTSSELRSDWRTHYGKELEQYGVSAEGRLLILDLALEANRQRTELYKSLEPERKEFVELCDQVKDAPGKKACLQARHSRDVALLARAAGRTKTEVAALVAAWD